MIVKMNFYIEIGYQLMMMEDLLLSLQERQILTKVLIIKYMFMIVI